MKWFRLYSSVLNDPKVQQLSPELFKHWINILCVASDHDPRGTLPPTKDLAFALRLKPVRCAKIVERLCAVGVLEMDTNGTPEVHGAYTARTVRVHNWESRQRESDNVAARVEKHRRRNNPDSEPAAIRNVTLHETLRKRSVDTDTERDTDKETLQVSGKVNINVDVVAETAAAAAWNDVSLAQTAERTRAILHLPPRDTPNLKITLKQYPCAPPYLEAEAVSCADWCAQHQKHPTLAGFNRWLHRSERERLSLVSSVTPAEKKEQSHGTSQSATAPYDPAQDEAFMERRRAAAELARRVNQRETS